MFVVSSRTLRDDTKFVKCEVPWEQALFCRGRRHFWLVWWVSPSKVCCNRGRGGGGAGRAAAPPLFCAPAPLFENQILWFYSFFRFSMWKNYFQLSALPLFTLLRGPCVKHYVKNELVMGRASQNHARGKNPQITSKRRDRWSLWGYEGKLNDYKLSCLLT